MISIGQVKVSKRPPKLCGFGQKSEENFEKFQENFETF